MTGRDGALPPAFYASHNRRPHGAAGDWWLLLHPPYTLWHLSYVAIGAAIAPTFDGGRLAATLLAFFLAVGIGAHALDELHGRPLGTSIPAPVLVAAATTSLALAVVIGMVGISRIGGGLLVFIVVGVAVDAAYNLEWFGGRFHNGITFAAAWGAFPVLAAYFAQAESLRPVAAIAALGAFWMSMAQRSLSTQARSLRRHTQRIDGTVTRDDGSTQDLSVPFLLVPIERALVAMSWAMVSLATALVVFRATA
jgi:hypothetical protein